MSSNNKATTATSKNRPRNSNPNPNPSRNNLDIDMKWDALDVEDGAMDAKLEGKAQGPSRKHYVYRAGKGERDGGVKPGEVKK